MSALNWLDFVLSVAWLLVCEEPFFTSCAVAVAVIAARAVRNEIHLWKTKERAR